MLEQLDELLGMDIEEIISSVHSLTLLDIYSKLYLNGAMPRNCAASQRKYFNELKKDYKMKKEKIERTCIPAWNGRMYIPGVFNTKGELVAGHLHIMSEILTDEKAKELLKIGALKKKDFLRLPGEKTEKKPTGYTSKELLDMIDKKDFNGALTAAKTLGLVKGNPNKEEVFGELKKYLSEDPDEV